MTASPFLAMAAPLVLGAAVFLPDRLMPRLAGPLGIAALGLVVVAAGGLALEGATGTVTAGPLRLHLDALSAVMLIAVAFIGTVVLRFSATYLDGHVGRGRFLRLLCLTVAAVLGLILSGHLLQLAAFWLAISLSLHRLLLFFPDRVGARLAARKKFLCSRLGDACLLGAIGCLYGTMGTLEIDGLAAAAAGFRAAGDVPPGVTTAALLLVFAAALKSAQFPAHGWLIEVMETPTPVSALLHAGVVSAGGYLILRMSPIVSLSETAMAALVLGGAASALVGAGAMRTQTGVKAGLAWSTLAQMGFMLMQIGLGAFTAAALHIVAHGLYKSHAFLSAGGVIRSSRPSVSSSGPGILIGLLIGAVVLAVCSGLAVGLSAGGIVLGAVLLIGVAEFSWTNRGSVPPWLLMAVELTICAVWITAHLLAMAVLGPVLPEGQAGGFAVAVAGLAIAGLMALVLLPVLPPHPWILAIQVHLTRGLYVNALTTRLVARIWPDRVAKDLAP